ncbi:H(+)-transporting V0 sector ATPase subunit a [Borealophlyctis nickersoniae]|nr:H(+)-transporting V0 sector ATPase subunit a [Borealophlyctis nickersoniae]
MPGNLLRSEDMSLIQLYIPLEIAQPTVAELGELGQIQFRDLNPDVNAFQRAFVNEVRRLDEMERKLRFLRTQIDKAEIPVRSLEGSMYYARSTTQQEIDELEERLAEHEARIQQMNNSLETLNKRYLELTELRHVLRETSVFFEEAGSRTDELLGGAHQEDSHLLSPAAGADDSEAAERGEGGSRGANLGFVAGVIPRARMATFERILFRALRGNLYMNFAEIDEPIVDPVTDETVKKNVFIIFAHGKEIIAKIRKICESMGATLYPVSDRPEKRREDALEVLARLEDLKHVLDSTRNARRQELAKVAENIEVWTTIVKKEKAIYYTMNMFNYDVNRKALIADGWCPTDSINAIQYALRGVTERTGSTIPPILNELHTTKEPPTYLRTNKFTVGFQEIIDAYGVAKYHEVNPGLFTVITFPFLFAVMFGDFGHGILVTVFAAWMVNQEKTLEKKKWGEIWGTFFGGRYIILLMGVFSIYTGLIYNDIFSKAMNIFGSGWNFVKEPHAEKWIGEQTGVYPFGVDPAWMGAENMLIFSNSYKMKMAIVMGVMHMTFGICLNVVNYIHFGQRMSIYLEFIPQITFLLSIFGYLVVLILNKWATYYPDPSQAPGLLNTLIYMVLSPGNVSEKDQIYPGQAGLQTFLVLLALICVPWMLLGKPYYLKRQHAKRGALGYAGLSDENIPDPSRPSEDSNAGGHGESSGLVDPHGDGSHGGEMGHEEHFDFGEIMIHQMIHTIEFCLNCISNTASYLRLWALSLAHAQLSEVLWEMVLAGVLTDTIAPGLLPFAIVIAFALWFVLTVSILLVMEGLSAFLHALRLHWVEFNGKFYAGTGTKFEPFAFATVLKEVEE